MLYWLVSSNLLTIMSSDECHRTLLMISHHWFRWWLGAVRQQAITWTSVDQDLQHHMASLGPNELTFLVLQLDLRENCFNSMAINAMTPYVTMPSATMEMCRINRYVPSTWAILMSCFTSVSWNDRSMSSFRGLIYIYICVCVCVPCLLHRSHIRYVYYRDHKHTCLFQRP